MKTKEQNPVITSAEKLEEMFGENVGQAVTYTRDNHMSYPEHITKPYLDRKHTSQEAVEYAKKLAEYEEKMAEYNAAKKKAAEHNQIVNYQLELYIKEVSGFNRLVPDDKKSKVWSRAWEDGHSSGYYDVYVHLCNLIEIFS